MVETDAIKFREAISATFAQAGVALQETTAWQLARFSALLVRWNQRISLTTVVSPRAIAERHLLDSQLATVDLSSGERIVDCGTGAGLPGIVVAVLRPDVHVTMVDRVAKKVAFVRSAIEALRLSNAAADRVDLEALTPSFDRAISRALMPPAEWLKVGRRIVGHGGRVGVMVARRTDLPAPALGCEIERIREVTLPSDGALRLLAWYRLAT